MMMTRRLWRREIFFSDVRNGLASSPSSSLSSIQFDKRELSTFSRRLSSSISPIFLSSPSSSSSFFSHLPLWNLSFSSTKFIIRTIYHQKEGLELLELDYSPVKIKNELFKSEEESLRTREGDSSSSSATEETKKNKNDYLFGLEFYGLQREEVREIYGEQPSLLILHENWGLNAYIRHLAQDFANKGFKVITPDLFRGKRTSVPEEALELERNLDWEKTLEELQVWVDHLRVPGYGESKSRVGILGVGMGGALAVAASIRLQKVFCAASIHGLPPLSTIPLPPHLRTSSSTSTFSSSDSSSSSDSHSTSIYSSTSSLPSSSLPSSYGRVTEGSLPVPLVIMIGEKDEVTGTLHDSGRFKSSKEYFEAASTEAPLVATLTTAPGQAHGFMNFTIPNKRRRTLGMVPYEHEIACAAFDLFSDYFRDILIRDPNPDL